MKDTLEDWQENCHVKGVNEEGIIYSIPNEGGTTLRHIKYKLTRPYSKEWGLFLLKFCRTERKDYYEIPKNKRNSWFFTRRNK